MILLYIFGLIWLILGLIGGINQIKDMFFPEGYKNLYGDYEKHTDWDFDLVDVLMMIVLFISYVLMGYISYSIAFPDSKFPFNFTIKARK